MPPAVFPPVQKGTLYMKIILDAMSGDNAPLEIIKGASLAAAEYNSKIILVGCEQTIRSLAEENDISLPEENFEFVNAEDVITMEDSALSVRSKKDSSMAVALRLLSEGAGDALVSAGNTGALYAGASLIVYRIKGFRKAAIATILPFEKPTLLIDSGANTVVTVENLEQFALMGSVYMEKIFGIPSPKVGLVNNGSESIKGTQLMQDTYAALSKNEHINFYGNVEGKDIPFGVCDVLVTDGFTGNIILKQTEGLAKFFMNKLKGVFGSNLLTKASALAIKGELKKLKHEFDASEYGGAPLLGISKPVIKAHGSSDAKAIKNAIRQAHDYISTGIIYEIAKRSIKGFAPEANENNDGVERKDESAN